MALSGIGIGYNSYGNTYSAQTKKSEEKETAATQKNSAAATGNNDYFNELSKLAPSVEFRIGTAHATDKTGKTLTLNPKLLERMQNDPAFEKDMKDMIKGVESMTKLADSFDKATDRTTVFRHSYIDANGHFSLCSLTVKKDELNEKLRKEAQENTEKLIERTREKFREKAEQLTEQLEEKRTEKADEESDEELSKAEELLKEKIDASDDGTIYMNDSEFWEIINAQKDGKGAQLDLSV